MFATLSRTATAAVTALALIAPAPALALGKNERNFLKGMLAAGAIAAIINHNNRQAGAAPRDPAPGYGYGYGDDRDGYRDRDHGRYTPGHDRPGDYRPPADTRSAAAIAFAEYSPASKRAIQSRLRAYGYYRGAIDGVWGPGTSTAIAAYARDTGNAQALASRDATVRLLNGLLT